MLLQESGKNSSQSGLPGFTLEEKRANEEIANIRYSQLPFLSESPNIILVNISGYTVVRQTSKLHVFKGSVHRQMLEKIINLDGSQHQPPKSLWRLSGFHSMQRAFTTITAEECFKLTG